MIAADLIEPFNPQVPAAITRLDYYGRELEIGSAALDTPFVVTERDENGIAVSELVDGAGRGGQLWQDSSFGWVQVYNGIGPAGPANHAVAVEPMTCPPDAFNSGEGLITRAGPEKRQRGPARG